MAAVTTGGPISEAATASNTVDVVLGYTNGFATRLGGTSQAVTRLRYLVDLTNQAYVDSQVNGQIRLVQTMQVNYADATSNQGALFQLTGVTCVPSNSSSRRLPDQGQNCTVVGQPAALQPLIAAREQYGADLVSLVRTFQAPENRSCGIAWLLGAGQLRSTARVPPSLSLSSVIATEPRFPDGGSTCREEYLAHELGHNMGLQHDRESSTGHGRHRWQYEPAGSRGIRQVPVFVRLHSGCRPQAISTRDGPSPHGADRIPGVLEPTHQLPAEGWPAALPIKRTAHVPRIDDARDRGIPSVLGPCHWQYLVAR